MTRDRLGRKRPAGVLMVLVLSLMLILTGCSAIPTTGPVGTLPAQDVGGQEDAPNFNVVGPTGGESAEAIVRGFFKAGLDSSDNYAVARQFLTKDEAATWDATSGALVEDTDPKIAKVGRDARQRATLHITREVGASGLRTDHPDGTARKLDFSLTKVNGEWRISAAPDGIVVDSANFDLIFSPATLYYYSDRHDTHMVPDVRWMAKRQGRTASIAAALLEGPAPYLRGAVYSAFPEDSRLSRPSVPVDEKVATVDVPESVVSGADDGVRERMVQQLTSTLVDDDTITSVQLSADQTPVDVDDAASAAVPPAEVDDVVVGLTRGRLVRYAGGSVSEVRGGADLGEDLSDPTAAPSQDAYAVLTGGGTRLVSLAPDGTRRELATGTSLLAPSYDSSSWVWSGESGASGPLVAYRAAGNSHASFTPDWLKGQQVTGLRVSADGTRLALVTRTKSGSHLLVSGIKRDDDGRPTGLATPMEVTVSAAATRVQWSAEDTLVVYAPGETAKVAPEQVDLSMHHQTWPLLLGLTSLAAAPGSGHQDLAVNADGVYRRENYTWLNVDEDLTDLSYRG